MALSKILPASQEQYAGARNLIINGACTISQRGVSTSFAHDGTTSAYSLDRFEVVLANADELDFTVTQDSDAPDGFSNSLKVTTGTAESSIASDEYVFMRQKMEGQNLQHLKYGTSAAVSTTVSFYVKSSQTGTFGISMYSADGNRNIGATYTINSANTWEYKTVTFAGDTSGTINNDNGDALNVIWHLASGSDFDSTDNTSWGAYSNARWAFGHAQDGVVTTASATWQITGVQLEVGEATPFEHRSFGDELARCQRYYYQITGAASSNPITLGWWDSSTAHRATFIFPVVMRATPTLSYSNLTDLEALRVNISWNAITAISLTGETSVYGAGASSTSTGGTQADASAMRIVNSGFIGFSAEL